MKERLDMRDKEELRKAGIRVWITRISTLVIATVIIFFLTSCAGTGGILYQESRHVSENFLEDTFDRTEDTGERMIGNLFNKIVKGSKKINISNSGCTAVRVHREDDGEISGGPYVDIPPEDGTQISVKLGVASNDREDFVLRAKHIGSIPPGCRDIGTDSEEFYKDYETERWRIRLR